MTTPESPSTRSAEKLFRRASLERLASPEQLDELMRVMRPHSWIALATLAVLVGGAVFWSIAGTIPVTVSARGALVTSAQLSRLPELAARAPSGELFSLSCFSLRDGGTLRPGMPLSVAPDHVAKQRYGTMPAELVAVTSGPIPRQVVASILGNEDLAAALTPPEGCMLGLSQMESDPTTVSGYRWAASDGPPGALVAGSPTRAEVVIARRRPISYVLPVLAEPTRETPKAPVAPAGSTTPLPQ